MGHSVLDSLVVQYLKETKQLHSVQMHFSLRNPKGPMHHAPHASIMLVALKAVLYLKSALRGPIGPIDLRRQGQ